MSAHSSYEPKTGFERWLDMRLPIIRLAWDSAIDFPTPKNLNYWWTFGGILALIRPHPGKEPGQTPLHSP